MKDREAKKKEDDYRRLALQLLNCYETNDQRGLLDVLTDQCVFNIGAGVSEGIVPYHGMHTGHTQIKNYLSKRRSNSYRADCLKRPPPRRDAPAPGEGKPAEGGHRVWREEDFHVHGNMVVAFGTLTDYFRDETFMHKSDFVLVIVVDEKENKISSFHYILDTKDVAEAWRKRAASAG